MPASKLVTPDFDRAASASVWAELDQSRKTVADLTRALQQIAEGLPHVRAPHRMTAAKALARNTLLAANIPVEDN